jgi:hypothetical protein
VANNIIYFTPLFTQPTTVWFEYVVVDDKMSGTAMVQSTAENSYVSDISNIPYDNIKYENINSIGRLWVYRYTLATAKELLGNIRAKYQEIPIPDASIRLDGELLRREGQQESTELIKELRETLEQTGHSVQMKKQVENSEAMQQLFRHVPIPIYIF